MLTFQTNKDKDLELSLFKRSVSYLFSYLCSYNENLTIKKTKNKSKWKIHVRPILHYQICKMVRNETEFTLPKFQSIICYSYSLSPCCLKNTVHLFLQFSLKMGSHKMFDFVKWFSFSFILISHLLFFLISFLVPFSFKFFFFLCVYKPLLQSWNG